MRIICSDQAVHLTLRKFEVSHHGRLNFIWQFYMPLVRGAYWRCIGWYRWGCIPCLSFACFLLCKIAFPCFVSTPRIMFHVHSIIQIIPLTMRKMPIGLYIMSDLIFPFYNSPLFKPRASGRVSAVPLTIWRVGCVLFWIYTAPTRLSTLQIICSSGEVYNHSILRVGVGQFLCHNNVIELIASQITWIIRCGGPLCFPLVLLYLEELP